MGYYLSVKENGIKKSRPISVINGIFFIERRICLATVVSSLEDAKELLRSVKRRNPVVSISIMHTDEYEGLSLEAIKHLRGL